MKWGAHISNGGAGTTAPPAGDGPALYPLYQLHYLTANVRSLAIIYVS